MTCIWQICTVSSLNIGIATDNALFSSEKCAFFLRKMLISFLILNKNICCGYSLEAPWRGASNELYSLEAPQRGASNEYLQHMYLSRNKKNIMWIPPLICSYALGHINPSRASLNCSRQHFEICFLIFPRKQVLIFHVNRLLGIFIRR